MMRTVWAVSQGQYSAYGVLAVFDEKEDAEKAVSAGYGDGVEEMTLYAAGEQPQRRLVYNIVYRVQAGAAVPADSWAPNPNVWCYAEWGEFGPRPKVRHHWQGDTRSLLSVDGTDRAGVLKVFAEQYAQWADEVGCSTPVPAIEFRGL